MKFLFMHQTVMLWCYHNSLHSMHRCAKRRNFVQSVMNYLVTSELRYSV